MDLDGVGLDFHDPGRHASEGTEGAIPFSVEVFRLHSKNSTYKYHLPRNITSNELADEMGY